MLPRQTSRLSTVKVGSSRDFLRRVSSLKQSRTSTAGLLSSSGSRQRRSCRDDDDDDDDVIFVRQRKEVLSYWSRTAHLAHTPETTEDWETFLTSHKPLTTQQSMWLRQQVAAPGGSQEGSRKFSRYGVDVFDRIYAIVCSQFRKFCVYISYLSFSFAQCAVPVSDVY